MTKSTQRTAAHSMTVLVVDDDPVSLHLHAALLRNMGFQVLTAATGGQALEAAQAHEADVQLVLLDLVLPDMTGFQVVEKLRSRSVEHYVSIILVSASTEIEDIERGLDLGADDYVTKPINRRELSARIRNVLRIRNMENELRSHAQTLERELNMAKQLQARLLPPRPTHLPGLTVSWHWMPSLYVAGDILDAFPCGEGKAAFYLADVSGHGVSAAMLSIWVNRHIRAWAARLASEDPLQAIPKLLEELDGLVAETETEQYLTLFFGVFDPASSELTYANAGHPSPYLLADDQARELPSRAGPVGFGFGLGFDVDKVAVQAGQTLLVCTDGILEARNDTGEFFGPERLVERALGAVRTKGDVISELADALREFLADAPANDDVTLVAAHFDT